MTHPAENSHIVVVAGGVAGIELAARLGRRARRDERFAVPVLDVDSAHVWKPMLRPIPAGTRDVDQQQMAYAAPARPARLTCQPGAMCGLDRERKEIEVSPLTHPHGRELLPPRTPVYDVLTMAVGSRANDFGTPGIKERCRTIDSRIEAGHFSREMRTASCKARRRKGNGRSASAAAARPASSWRRNSWRWPKPPTPTAPPACRRASRYPCSKPQTDCLPAFPEDISQAAWHRLAQLGVAVRLAAQVSAAEEGGFRLNDGQLMPGMPKVWAAGVKAPDFLPELGGLATTRNDQLLVMPCLHATRDSSSFAVGDCASLKPPATERALPPTAHVADRSDICRFGWAARRLVHLPIRISALWSRWHAMTVRVPLASSVCSPGARSKADGYN